MSAKDIAPYKGKRRKLLEVLANAECAEMDITEVCRNAGISRSIYYKYIDETSFQDALKSVVSRNYSRFSPQIANSVIKAAKKGNIKAAELTYKVMGWLDAGNKQTVNVAVSSDPMQEHEYASNADALADVERTLTELQTQADILRQAIAQENASGSRLPGHGIHPDKTDHPQDET
jgi:hypothetical protein